MAIPPRSVVSKTACRSRVRTLARRAGMIRFRGALPPEVGVPFVNRVDAETDRAWRTAKRANRLETRNAHAADAFVRLTAEGRSARGNTDLVVVVDLRAYRRGHAHSGGSLATSWAADRFRFALPRIWAKTRS